MSVRLIARTDVPALDGTPGLLGDYAADVESAGESAATRAGAVTTAWNGVNDENYKTPEALGVRQSIPRITDPMSTIESNLQSVATALSTASTTLITLRTQRTTLLEDIDEFRTRALAADAAGVCTEENPSGTGWEDDYTLVGDNSALWTRAGQLQTAIDQAETDLLADLTGIFAPSPWLPTPEWTPGAPAGTTSSASAEGPGASADAWAGGYWDEDGNYYTGAGAEAEAHLFDLNADARYDGPWGTATADASLDASAAANAQANASFGVDGVHGNAQAGAFAGVRGDANASYDAGPLSVGVGAKGMAGAEAEAEAGLSVGLDGVSANAGVTAFAGAKAEVEGSAEVLGAEVTGGADVRAGIGGEAEVDVAVTADEVRVSLDVGFALGVGAGVDVDLSFKPKELVDDVKGFFGF